MTRTNTYHLSLKKLGIDTYKEAVLYIRKDCHICLSEGFEAQTRVHVSKGTYSITATLNIIDSDILEKNQASLSEYAWKKLHAKEGEEIIISHAKPLLSFSSVRSKIYGNALSSNQIQEIVQDIIEGNYSDIHLTAFLTACANNNMSLEETTSLTKSMVESGAILSWSSPMVVDKHCVGGLPGNRTTPIIVPIVASFGLTIPKTSSRAITSPAGTADTMEVLAPVNLSLSAIRKVVEKENGCIAWGGSITLSPADDIIICVERALDIDSEAQLVASVLSKKIAAGSTHVLIDMPIGPTAKVRSQIAAESLKTYLEQVGRTLGLEVKVLFSDGTQPIGRGIGPSLEARDVLEVLQCKKHAPQDLRKHALRIAGSILEFSPSVKKGEGLRIATNILNSGEAWLKFQRICEAQGGMRPLFQAQYTHTIQAKQAGIITGIDNRRISLVAKLAGAPHDPLAGVDLHTPIGTYVKKHQPLFTIHANTSGGLKYALHYLHQNPSILTVKE